MNTQQRRWFFSSVTSVVKSCSQRIFVERHFRPCGRIAVACVAALLFCSCSSLTPERVTVLSAIAGQAAQVGASAWLAKHPEHRASFEAVIAALTALARNGNTNETAFVELMSSLPTSTLAGPDGEVYITEADVVVWDAHLKKAVSVEGPVAEPVMKATLAGMRKALGPQPPMPTARRPALVVKSRANSSALTARSDLVFMPTVAVTNPPAVAPAGRTNVTRSAVDVHGAALTVRWQAAPKSVYHIEHSTTGTNWQRVGCLTNLNVRGQTNWTMPMLPGAAVGQWRVLRLR